MKIIKMSSCVVCKIKETKSKRGICKDCNSKEKANKSKMDSSNNIQKERMLQNEGSTSLNDSYVIGNRMNEYYERNIG